MGRSIYARKKGLLNRLAGTGALPVTECRQNLLPPPL